MGLSNKPSCEAGSFSRCHLNPHRSFQSVVLRSPGLGGLFCSSTVPPGLSVCECGAVGSASHPRGVCQLQPGLSHSTICHLAGSASHCLAVSPLYPGCPSLPLLPVCLNVSSLSPWLSDFHAVRFSVSSGCFLFLNLLSFFWLCRRSKCIYLCLHLGWKRSSISTSVKPNTHIFYFFQNPTSITNIYVS